MGYPTDSPLSITASVAGILTFVAAIAAGLYVRFTYLRNADNEYFQVKTSLSWYKTESTWMSDLIHAADRPSSKTKVEDEMYLFVMEQLGKLEERLLELLTEVEDGANKEYALNRRKRKKWTVTPGTGISLSWLPVRTKALELVRQRDALGSRVLFAQMSMLSSRVKDHESRSKKDEEHQMKRLDRLEDLCYAQHEKLDKLEDLVYRVMHRDRVGSNDRNGDGAGNSESPKYEEESPVSDGGLEVSRAELDAHQAPEDQTADKNEFEAAERHCAISST